MCVTNERIREVTGLLDNTTDDNRTIIFAAKKEDVIKLYTVIDYGKCSKILTKLLRQTVQTQARLLLMKQSDQGLPCFLFGQAF